MNGKIRNTLYAIVLFVSICLVTMVLYHFLGAVVAGIYATITLLGWALFIYEIFHAPLMEDDDQKTENQ